MRISVVTPSHRPERLEIIRRSLAKQTFRDFEWLVCSPVKYKDCTRWIPEPKKKPDDFYNLNKAWNNLFYAANGKIIVSWVDSTWLDENALDIISRYYDAMPKVCLSGFGNQYTDFSFKNMSWKEERPVKIVRGLHPVDMEFRFASVPFNGFVEAGGFDENFDKYAALSEKELCVRLGDIGYQFLMDERLEYKFVKHEDHGPLWDQRYREGLEYFGSISEKKKPAKKELVPC